MTQCFSKKMALGFSPNASHQPRRVLHCGDQSMRIIRTETHCVPAKFAEFFSKIKLFFKKYFYTTN